MVEHRLPKPRVAGPSPVSRSSRSPCISTGFPEFRRVRRSVYHSALAPLMHQTVGLPVQFSANPGRGHPRQSGESANVCYQRLRSAISFASLGPLGHVGRGWWVQIPPRPCPQPADSARSAGLLRRSWKGTMSRFAPPLHQTELEFLSQAEVRSIPGAAILAASAATIGDARVPNDYTGSSSPTSVSAQSRPRMKSSSISPKPAGASPWA